MSAARALALSVLLAVAGGVIYLAWAPPSADLAAQTFRADLFGREGFALWNAQWYGGHHLPAYSVLFPPLAALLGPRGAGAVAAVACAGLFAPLVRGHWGERAWLGAAWFAAGAAGLLLTGRMAFLLGFAIGLGALLAWQRGRFALGVALAALTGLGSPVAAVFLAVAGAATLTRRGFVIAAVTIAPVVVLTAVFPEGGGEPFVFSAFFPALLVPPFVALVLPGERTLLVGAVLLAAIAVLCFVVTSPVGGNVVRLAPMVLGPLTACALLGRRDVLLAALALPLLAWQFSAGVRNVAHASGDPSVHPGYSAPLVSFMTRKPGPPGRVEIPFTANHWEATWVALHVPIARGWERQLDHKVNPVFYEGTLTPARYERWLRASGVSWVALPDVDLDPSARAEARLLRAGQPYLIPAWRSAHWRVWRVRGARGIVPPPARLVAATPDTLTIRMPRAGAVVVRERWTPYWLAKGACVSPTAGDWTRVAVRGARTVTLRPAFSVTRIHSRGRRCG